MMPLQRSLEPGIYFGLDEDVYHTDPALSRTDMVNLLDTPNTYWKHSYMNPDRVKKKSSDAMDYGSAFDCLMFEPKRFAQKYQVIPIDEWAPEKEKISHEDYFKIIESIKVLRKGKDAMRFLTGGKPQVTVVFDYMGFRFRTRHDYFTPVLSTDFKTARSLHVGHLRRAFEEFGYDIQLALYSLARQVIKDMLRTGTAEVYGAVDGVFMEQFMADTNNGFIFVFQRSSAPFPFLPLMPEDDTYDSGLRKVERAVGIYQSNLKEYGTKEWPVCEGRVKPFSMFYGLRE